MKLIDNKGRFFGKINIVDLLAICLLILATCFVSYKLINQDGAGGSSELRNLTYTVMVSGVTPELCDHIETYIPNDQLLASDQLLDGYIIDMTKAPHVDYYYDNNGVPQAHEEEGEFARYDVTFTISVNIPNTVTNMVGVQEVRVGKSHFIKTPNIELSGIIQSFYYQ